MRVREWAPAEATPAADAAHARPPLVVLHGFLEQGAAWDAVARATGRRVLLPDLRGHGQSGHVGGGGFYHFWDYVPDVDALVEAVGAPVDLLGHSMGGTVACLYAGTRPDAVRRLVLVEGLGPPDLTHEAVERARAVLAERRAPPTHRPMRDAAEAAERLVRSTGVDPLTARRLADRSTVPADGGVRWSWDPLHRARTPAPFQVGLFREFLREIRCPVLLVDGARSTFRVPDAAERVACLADARAVVIDGAGHFPHYDAPEALAAAIRTHLE
jgi:pimeloyl-ACP methyl ester carboxylesterase